MADLEMADLPGANLEGANLEGANLKMAKIEIHHKQYLADHGVAIDSVEWIDDRQGKSVLADY